jgi:RHS repeat-associated protein
LAYPRSRATPRSDEQTSTCLPSSYRDYDTRSNMTATRSPRSASATDDTYKSSATYDQAGRLTTVTQPVSATASMTTGYRYDTAGNLTGVVDGRNNVTTYTYTPWNTLASTIEPSTPGQTTVDLRTFTNVYDAGGLPIKSLEPQVTVTRTFDQLGRLTNEQGTSTVAANPAANRTMGYDLAGRMTSFTDPAGTVTVTRDDRGLVLSATNPGSTTIGSSFTYDAAGRTKTRTDASGTSTFTYTTRGELDTAVDPATGLTIDRDYNTAGELSTIKYGTAATRTLGYDGLGRLTTDELRAGTTLTNGASYTYDAESNITQANLTVPGNPATGTHNYSYDRAGRLSSWQQGSAAATGYSYDAAGNRTQAGATTFGYDARNRLTTSGATTTTWSPRGTMTAVGATTVQFDALGRQTGWGATAYTYDSLDRIKTRGAITASYAGIEIDPAKYGTQQYARNPNGTLMSIGDGTNKKVVGTNRHGDVAWLMGPTGTVTDSRVWTPFGETAGATGTTNPTVGFQGDITDATTGNIWMGARWYQPSTDNFTARDTVFGTLDTPVSLNRYTYANNDPIEFFDPDGRFSVRSFVSSVTNVFNAGVSVVSNAYRGVRAGAAFVARNVVKPVVRVASVQGVRAINTARSLGNSMVVSPTKSVLSWAGRQVDACVGSANCRRAVIGTAIVAGMLVAPTVVGTRVAQYASGGFVMGVATCGGDTGCIIDQTYAGAVSGFVPVVGGQYVNAALTGAAGASSYEWLSTGKTSWTTAATGAATAVAITGAFNGAKTVVGPSLSKAWNNPTFRSRLANETGAINPKGFSRNNTTEAVPPRFITTGAGTTIDRASVGTAISGQRQGRHLAGASQYNGGGYFNSLDDAQGVLDAFHSGSAQVLGTTRAGNIVVRVPGVTGFNNNPAASFVDQATDVFFIKGSSSVSVVPANPNWVAG